MGVFISKSSKIGEIIDYKNLLYLMDQNDVSSNEEIYFYTNLSSGGGGGGSGGGGDDDDGDDDDDDDYNVYNEYQTCSIEQKTFNKEQEFLELFKIAFEILNKIRYNHNNDNIQHNNENNDENSIDDNLDTINESNGCNTFFC